MNRRSQLTWEVEHEASVQISIDIDGRGRSVIDCGHQTLNHLLETFARYGRFDVEITVKGDAISHHIFEQTGTAFGQALNFCLTDRESVKQFAISGIPMDNTMVQVAVDINQKPGRLYFRESFFDLSQHHGDVEVSCYIHFLEKMAIHANINIHVITLYADDIHHAIETLYKVVAMAIYEASRSEQKPIARLNRKIQY